MLGVGILCRNQTQVSTIIFPAMSNQTNGIQTSCANFPGIITFSNDRSSNATKL